MQDISATSAWLMIPANGVTISFNNKMVTLAAYWMTTPTYKADKKQQLSNTKLISKKSQYIFYIEKSVEEIKQIQRKKIVLISQLHYRRLSAF